MDLFDENISRLKVLSAKKEIPVNAKIFVHRNHSFEMIGNILNAFLNYSNLEAAVEYSSYDDSLTFGENIESGLQLLWLDLSRYNSTVIGEFVKEKVEELRNKTNSPILVAYLGNGLESLEINVSDVTLVNVNSVIDFLKEKAFDLERESLLGTRLSNKASLCIAQYLGLKIIPSILRPALKAIVLDLDNTLYKGIIGEDGIENVVPYNNLQSKLKSLKEQGFLLCICSKNEESDAVDLFKNRGDFLLKWEDFTVAKVNWNSKAENIIQIAQELNIGLDSMLFIDDNIAEIESVKAAIDNIQTIIAVNENETLRHLELYPCLMKKSVSKEDSLRSADLVANKERAELAKNLSMEDYFKKLDIKIELTLNDEGNKCRIAELLNKTNQFILAYKRYNLSDVEKILQSDDYCVVTAKMSDKLSDSGIIAILIAKKDKHDLLVDELTFSCRALGRNIEDIVITKMLMMSKVQLNTSEQVKIYYKTGPRNAPALNWLSAYCGVDLHDEGIVIKKLSDDFVTYGLNMKEVIYVK